MKSLLPLIYERLVAILPDPSLPSVNLQHQILKIFYATMQVNDIHNAVMIFMTIILLCYYCSTKQAFPRSSMFRTQNMLKNMERPGYEAAFDSQIIIFLFHIAVRPTS